MKRESFITKLKLRFSLPTISGRIVSFSRMKIEARRWDGAGKMRRGHGIRNPVAILFLVLTTCCCFLISISMLRLPEITRGRKALGSYYATAKAKRVVTEKAWLSKFGEMMIGMLPQDLAFTVFAPSDRAFERDLGLRPNVSFEADKFNDTYAVVSRILGFSAIPRSLPSAIVPSGKQLCYDSVSGHALYISKDEDGLLLVNRLRLEHGDLRKGPIIVHVIDGVIMDADFEQSVGPEDEEDE